MVEDANPFEAPPLTAPLKARRWFREGVFRLPSTGESGLLQPIWALAIAPADGFWEDYDVLPPIW
jgi:hypothetical protein